MSNVNSIYLRETRLRESAIVESQGYSDPACVGEPFLGDYNAVFGSVEGALWLSDSAPGPTELSSEENVLIKPGVVGGTRVHEAEAAWATCIVSSKPACAT